MANDQKNTTRRPKRLNLDSSDAAKLGAKGKAAKKVDTKAALAAATAAGHGGDDRHDSTVSKKASDSVKTVKKPVIKKKSPQKEATVQYNARIPESLRMAIDNLAEKQEPDWKMPYMLKRMYLALCKELGEEPEV